MKPWLVAALAGLILFSFCPPAFAAASPAVAPDTPSAELAVFEGDLSLIEHDISFVMAGQDTLWRPMARVTARYKVESQTAQTARLAVPMAGGLYMLEGQNISVQVDGEAVDTRAVVTANAPESESLPGFKRWDAIVTPEALAGDGLTAKPIYRSLSPDMPCALYRFSFDRGAYGGELKVSGISVPEGAILIQDDLYESYDDDGENIVEGELMTWVWDEPGYELLEAEPELILIGGELSQMPTATYAELTEDYDIGDEKPIEVLMESMTLQEYIARLAKRQSLLSAEVCQAYILEALQMRLGYDIPQTYMVDSLLETIDYGEFIVAHRFDVNFQAGQKREIVVRYEVYGTMDYTQGSGYSQIFALLAEPLTSFREICPVTVSIELEDADLSYTSWPMEQSGNVHRYEGAQPDGNLYFLVDMSSMYSGMYPSLDGWGGLESDFYREASRVSRMFTLSMVYVLAGLVILAAAGTGLAVGLHARWHNKRSQGR